MTIRIIQRLPLFAALTAVVLCCPPTAWSAGSVGTCDESHLKTALSGGGLVTFSCTGTITLSSTIVISASTIIAGPGVTISGANTVRIFAVAPGVTLTLANLTLSGGASTSGGGAILNAAGGTVNVSYCTFTGNTATGTNGGGAILNNGTLTVTASSFGLPTGGGNTGASGGAIANLASGNLMVTQSTFANNTVNGNPGSGGAIYNLGAMGVVNSTFFANGSSTAFGGNIYSNTATTVAVSSSTITNGIGTLGANLYNAGSGGFDLTDSIVANVSSTPLTPPNCFGTITDGTGNLTWPNGDNSCGTKGIGNPNLGPLANNSGPTATMALMAGSAAIENSPASCPTGDQRGVLRPAYPCDTGAYEYTPLLIAVINTMNVQVANLPPTCNCIVNKKIVEPFHDSLAPSFWLPDGNHLNPQIGTEVFNLHEQAVQNLSDLIVDQTQLIYITTLVFVDRSLAVITMNDKGCFANPGPSVSASANGSVCAQAAAQLAAGDASAGRGAYANAIDSYQSAWQLTKP